MAKPETSDGRTRLEYILDVALDPGCERQWPQMGEVVRGSALIADVEGNFPELTLEVGRRLRLDGDIVVAEWTCDYGDGRTTYSVSIGAPWSRTAQLWMKPPPATSTACFRSTRG